jgi:hypothetical protein
MNETLEYAPGKIAARDTLFGDLPLAYWAGTGAEEMPWLLFKQARRHLNSGHREEAVQALEAIVSIPGLESRQYLQAWHFLSQLGIEPTSGIQVYGVVVEVVMDGGLDILAVYADHSARYYNYSGSAIIWDQPDHEIGTKIDDILQQGENIIKYIGPWKEVRPAAPVKGKARLNILTSNGLYFGEADQMVLFKDVMAGKTMYAMLDILEKLIHKTNAV